MKIARTLLLACSLLPTLCLAAPDAANPNTLTDPEFQLEDNAKAADPQRCGWLYGLYQPPIDPQTGNGYLARQGDHGSVSFRNIKVRPL